MGKVKAVVLSMFKSKRFWAGLVLVAASAGYGSMAPILNSVEAIACVSAGGCTD